MTLFSPYEDFVLRTLSAFGSSLEKLAYLRGLRNADGHYYHWGISRRFGQENASQALAQAHTELWLEVLRTPIPVLFANSQELATDSARPFEAGNGAEDAWELTPANLGGGSKRHFSSVLLAVSLLSRAAREPNQRAA
jgi:hypothetical protein